MKAVSFAVAILALASALSPAWACAFHSGVTKSSDACPAGQVWDGASQACVSRQAS